MTWTRILGDAFHLPLASASVDVIVADPPYEGTARRKPRGKRGLSMAEVGYVEYAGREWLDEAFRVLKPTGHIYIVIPVKELSAYLRLRSDFVDVIAWMQPNGSATAAYWRRGTRGRAPAWRPILHYAGEEAELLEWPGGFVGVNWIEAPTILSFMHEAMPWPNQLPNKLLRHLLAPHSGVVLDLFSGTASCAAAAAERGLPCISIDMSLQALALGTKRGRTQPMFAEAVL